MKLKIASLAVFCALSTLADTNTLIITGQSKLQGAGHFNVPAADSPPGFSFAPSAGKVLVFHSVTGTIDFGDGNGSRGPDDEPVGWTWSLPPSGGISGLADAYRGGFMSGVFLDDAEPEDPAPVVLDFGSIGHSFAALAPKLRQVFFIGDGLMGHGSGSTQQFLVPAGATRLYLGVLDSLWSDNSGEFTAKCEIVPADSSVRFESSSLTSNIFDAQVLAPPGQNYILQASTELGRSNWVSLSTNLPIASPFIVTDSNADSSTNRFYRIFKE